MQGRQRQVVHDSVQDRLVLRIATQANEEIRVFLTRRYLREIWPHLAAMLAGRPGAVPPQMAAAEACRDAADPDATFAQPFREDNPVYPLGNNPLLATEATFEAAENGGCRLTLRERRERCVALNLDAGLLQALCSMLRAGAGKGGWDLALDYSPATVPMPAPGGKTLLH